MRWYGVSGDSLAKKLVCNALRFIHPQGSPRLYRNASVLRERMSAFRSAFHSIQETEKMAGGPSASEADGESKMAALSTYKGFAKVHLVFHQMSFMTKRFIST